MEEDFQSLNKGVFVVPFDAAAAGPSRPKRLLKRVYEATHAHCVEAHSRWEQGMVETQLDDIAEWLEGCQRKPLLKRTSNITRLHVAVMQDMSSSVPKELRSICARAKTIHTKEAMDLSMGIRNVVLGFIGEEALVKKSAKSGMDRLEEWFHKQKDRSPLLLHIQQAQLIPPAVLSELTYILAIHPSIPFRLLLSVSSVSLFLSSWTHVEPSLIDFNVIASSRARRRGTAIDAILNAAMDTRYPGFSITEDLADELREMQDLTGGGPAALLKSLKWILLYHSFNSPLALLEGNDVSSMSSIVQALREGKEDIPGKALLQIDTHADITSTLDPAPRISILHALAHPESFAPPAESDPSDAARATAQQQPRKTSGRKRRRDGSKSPDAPVMSSARIPDAKEGGDLSELRTLFELWKAAGRNVNLWDWFEGFRGAVQEATRGTVTPEDEVDNAETKQAKKVDGSVDREPRPDGQELDETVPEAMDPEVEDRLHAAFIRFCEEARMLGLVRARGGRTAKRADEVVKGIGLV